MSKTIEKEFSLFEIKIIYERLKYLMSLEMKAGTRYRIDQWAKSFQSKGKDIEKRNNDIIINFCHPGELTVRDERKEECQKELNDFFSIKDTVEFSLFKLEWIDDLITTDLTILHQFMNEDLFKEPENK